MDNSVSSTLNLWSPTFSKSSNRGNKKRAFKQSGEEIDGKELEKAKITPNKNSNLNITAMMEDYIKISHEEP